MITRHLLGFLLHVDPLDWLAVVLLLLAFTEKGRHLVVAVFSPVLEEESAKAKALVFSLGRLSMAAWVAFMMIFGLGHPKDFAHINAWAALIWIFGFIVLACYVYGNKPYMRDYLDNVIRRLPGGQAGAVEQVEQTVDQAAGAIGKAQEAVGKLTGKTVADPAAPAAPAADLAEAPPPATPAADISEDAGTVGDEAPPPEGAPDAAQ